MPDTSDEFTKLREKLKAKSSKEVINGFVDMMKQKMNLRSEDVQPPHSFWYHRPTTRSDGDRSFTCILKSTVVADLDFPLPDCQ